MLARRVLVVQLSSSRKMLLTAHSLPAVHECQSKEEDLCVREDFLLPTLACCALDHLHNAYSHASLRTRLDCRQLIGAINICHGLLITTHFCIRRLACSEAIHGREFRPTSSLSSRPPTMSNLQCVEERSAAKTDQKYWRKRNGYMPHRDCYIYT